MSIESEPDPILRVTVGMPIYTDDGQKIGAVKEVLVNAFKVGTPLLQRDYWLAADTIKSATPGEAVMLAIDKAHLGQRKLKERPAAA